MPGPHGLAYRRHAPRSERPAEHHEKNLKLKGKSHGGLHVGRNASIICGQTSPQMVPNGTSRSHSPERMTEQIRNKADMGRR